MGRAILQARGRAAPRASLALAAGLALTALLCLATPSGHAQGPATAHRVSASAAAPDVHPSWAELNPVQQRILSPLVNDWDNLSDVHRRKWLQIAVRYQHLQPAEQQKLQARMAEWVKLTPQQRRTARENYQITRSLPAEKKAEAWDTYQKLPEDQKQRLADAEKVPPRPGAVSALPGKRQPTQASRHLRPERKPVASQPAAVPPGAPRNGGDAAKPAGQHEVPREARTEATPTGGAEAATRQ